MREPLKLQLTAPPARLPVDLNELRAQVRLEDDRTDEDAILLANLRAAAEACETYTGRSLITQTWTQFRDAWPDAELGDALHEGWREGPLDISGTGALLLPRPPLQAVVHVKTFSAEDAETLWPASAYFVDTAGLPGRLVPRKGQVFPVVGRGANGIEIQFIAGHGDAPGDVPSQLRQGIVQLAAYLFENRGDGLTGSALTASGAESLWRASIVARL